jgi:hypothetical protein
MLKKKLDKEKLGSPWDEQGQKGSKGSARNID